MLTLGVEDAADGFENRTFGCRKCHHSETRLLAADPMKTGAAGWLSGELGRPEQEVRMVEYRAYEIGEDEHIWNYRAFACEGDADAMVWAKQLLDGNDIELWSGERFVIRLNHGGVRPIFRPRPDEGK
jgi:hypothetical protein